MTKGARTRSCARRLLVLSWLSLLLSWLPLVLLPAATGCSEPEPIVAEAPPPPRAESLGVRPGPDYFWSPGHWRWDAGTSLYIWQPGRWERERRHDYWVPGSHQRVAGGWQWVEGHWEPKP